MYTSVLLMVLRRCWNDKIINIIGIFFELEHSTYTLKNRKKFFKLDIIVHMYKITQYMYNIIF